MALTSYTFDQLINFTRTTSATYINSSGLLTVTPASVNLLTYTQEFDNAAWFKTSTTIAANTTVAPDGTSTADTMTATAGTSARSASQGGGGFGSPLTMTVYAKAGTIGFIQIFHGSAALMFANFNLITGAVGTVGAGATADISAVGNGWYRCSLTFTPGAAATTRVAMVSSATATYNESWTAIGTENLFVWGAQLELGAFASPYTKNVGGLYPPRFDYDPVTLQPRGLLIEEQRVNLLLQSEEFDNAGWVKSGATVTANATTSPDGTADADKIIENTANSQHRVSQPVTVTNGIAYTYSIYAKAAERTSIWVRVIGVSTYASCVVDLTNGAISTPTGTCTATNVGNGWYRITVSGTSDSTTATVFANLIDGAGANTYTGDGTSGVYVWGAQIEVGAFATSYIPTVASQVTRTADQCAIVAPNFAPWYNQSEGTFVVEAITSSRTSASANNETLIAASNILTAVRGAGTVSLGWFIGSTTFRSFSYTTANATIKTAAAYQAGNNAASLNGGAPVTDTGSTYSSPTSLGIGNIANSQYLNGHLRNITYYPVRLTNAQLQALTA